MILKLGGIEVFFPMPKVYPEQLQYMKEMFEIVQGRGHCLIEMPTGTGKTVTLLSFLVSHQIHQMTGGIGSAQIRSLGMRRKQGAFKIVYCTRTTAELQKVLNELKNLYAYIRANHIPDFQYLALGMAARRMYCVNPEVNKEKTSRAIDKKCKDVLPECAYFQGYVNNPHASSGVYSLDELRSTCESDGRCPYYTARTSLPLADCIVYTYNYMIDPRISEIVNAGLGSNCIVIFDEAHNIDGVCVESLSVSVTRATLDSAWRSIDSIGGALNRIGQTQTQLQNSLHIQAQTQLQFQEPKAESRAEALAHIPFSSTPGISSSYGTGDRRAEKRATKDTPGSLRTAKGFVSAAKRVVEYLKTRIKSVELSAETTEAFIRGMEETVFVDYSALVHISKRLRVLTAEIERDGEALGDTFDLAEICDFCTLAAQFRKGFSIILEPFDAYGTYDPVLRLVCLDASIAMRHVFSTYRNVIITSGTLSPIAMYPRILDFSPVKAVEIDVSSRRGFCALVVTKGSDQMALAMGRSAEEAEETEGLRAAASVPQDSLGVVNANAASNTNAISSSFSLRGSPAVVRNYGNLVLEVSAVVPDGLVCFFPSYRYMEEAVAAWTESGMISKITQNKLIFAESLDHEETDAALAAYKKACDSGRGAVLFSVARGKVSEGVDFSGCYGRGVLVLGVPFQYTESPRLKKRLEFLAQEFGVRESEFLSFDAMRQTAQCMGRVLRSSGDYGLAVLADRRFNALEKRVQLPRWIQRHIGEHNTNLSIDMCVALSRNFFRGIAGLRHYE